MLALLIRDLRLATRAGGGFGLGLAFFLIVCTLVPFGVGPEGGTLALIAPGILWVGALLACLLSLDRIFALDWEDGSLDLLATAPLPMEGAVLVKAAAHWITTGLPLVVAAPVFGILLHLPSGAQGWLVAALLLGTPALSILGAFGGAAVNAAFMDHFQSTARAHFTVRRLERIYGAVLVLLGVTFLILR